MIPLDQVNGSILDINTISLHLNKHNPSLIYLRFANDLDFTVITNFFQKFAVIDNESVS